MILSTEKFDAVRWERDTFDASGISANCTRSESNVSAVPFSSFSHWGMYPDTVRSGDGVCTLRKQQMIRLSGLQTKTGTSSLCIAFGPCLWSVRTPPSEICRILQKCTSSAVMHEGKTCQHPQQHLDQLALLFLIIMGTAPCSDCFPANIQKTTIR